MKKRVWVGFVLASMPAVAHAQNVGGGGSIALPEIEIDQNSKYNPYAGRYDGAVAKASDITGIDKPLIDTPRSVYVVTPQTLRQQMPQSLAEAVETIPGTFTGNTGGGNSDFITIKGFEVNTSDAFSVGNDNGLLIDGIRSPTDRAFNANTQSVSILSGPASYLYGYASEGGVLNVERKLPLPDAHYAVDLLVGNVTGSFKDVAGSFDFTGPIYKSTEGVLAYRLVGSAARDAPWREGDAITRDFLMAPTFAWYSDVFTATIAYEHGKNQQPYDRGDTSVNGAPLAIPATVSYSEPYSVYDEHYDWVHGKIDYRFDKDTDFHMKYSYAGTNLTYNEVRSDNQTDFNPATGSIDTYQYTNAPYGGYNTEQGFLSFNGVRRFDTGPIHHEFQAGVDYYNLNSTEGGELTSQYTACNLNNFNLYSPVYGGQTTTCFVPFQSLYAGLSAYGINALGNNQQIATEKQRELGVFGQEAATLGPLTITGGLRYVDIYQYEQYIFVDPDADSYEHAILPSASVLYKITPNFALYGDYAQSYRPNVYAVGTGGTATLGTNVVAGTLKPETGIGYEAGAKASFLNGKVFAQLSFYEINKTNAQTINENDQITFEQSQQSKGLSLSVVGSVTPNIDINVAYNHQHAYVTSDLAINNDLGAQLINAPDDIFTVLAAYKFLNGPLNHLTLTAGVTGASRNPVDAENSFFLPGFAVASLGASYSYKPAPTMPLMTLSFKVNNLFNSDYYPSTGSKTNWITVGEPRNYLMDLSMAL